MIKMLAHNGDWLVDANTDKALLADIPQMESKTGVTLPQTFTAIAAPVKSFKRYGLITQASTPTPSSPVPLMCNGGPIVPAMWESFEDVNGQEQDDIVHPAEYIAETITLNGVTMNIPPLFSTAGGQKDELDLLTGIRTSYEAVYFLDGTEEYGIVSGSGVIQLDKSEVKAGELVWCTHFAQCAASYTTAQMPENTVKTNASTNGKVYFKHPSYINDLNGWVTWVEQQYAAGTPVTIVCRRTEPMVKAYADKTDWATVAGSNTITDYSQVSGQLADITYIIG